MDTDPDLRYHFIHEKLEAKGLDDNIAVALAAETALAHSRLPHWSARWWSMTTFAWRNVSKRSKQWSRLLQSPSRKGSDQNDVESSLPVRPMFSRPTWTLKHPQKGRRKQKPPPEPPKSVGGYHKKGPQTSRRWWPSLHQGTSGVERPVSTGSLESRRTSWQRT